MKYNIGDTVYIKGEVEEINITPDRTAYKLGIDRHAIDEYTGIKGITLLATEDELSDIDCISTEDYEREINDLKEDVEQWRDMYQAEHIKVEKLNEENDRNVTFIDNIRDAVTEVGIDDLDAFVSKHIVNSVFEKANIQTGKRDFSHNPEKNSYTKYNFDTWRMP